MAEMALHIKMSMLQVQLCSGLPSLWLATVVLGKSVGRTRTKQNLNWETVATPVDKNSVLKSKTKEGVKVEAVATLIKN
jgi:hypothetical protein